jgi:hypothetical protein
MSVVLARPPEWTERAACVSRMTPELDLWHPPEEAPRKWRQQSYRLARRVCMADCPVQAECTRLGLELLAEGLADGMYGGLDPDELRALARRLSRPTRKVAQHGERSCYVGGCRRPECVRANADYEHGRRISA